jgi:hypothetical protein
MSSGMLVEAQRLSAGDCIEICGTEITIMEITPSVRPDRIILSGYDPDGKRCGIETWKKRLVKMPFK